MDTDSEISYKLVLLALVAVQAVSVIANFFMSADEQLIKERVVYAFSITGYMIIAFLIKQQADGKLEDLFWGFDTPDSTTIALMAGIIGLSLWYFSICFRELRELMTSKHSEYD